MAAAPLAVVLVDEQYEDLEVHYPLLRLREAGYHVEVAGDKVGHNYSSKHGYWAKSTKLFSEIPAAEVKVLVVPGGWAPDRLRRWKDCLKLVQDVNAAGGIIGAPFNHYVSLFLTHNSPVNMVFFPIQHTFATADGSLRGTGQFVCVAEVPYSFRPAFRLTFLYHCFSAKIMKGKKSTCFIAIKDDIIHAGAEYSEERVVVDGNMCAAPVFSLRCPFIDPLLVLTNPFCFSSSGYQPRLQTTSLNS